MSTLENEGHHWAGYSRHIAGSTLYIQRAAGRQTSAQLAKVLFGHGGTSREDRDDVLRVGYAATPFRSVLGHLWMVEGRSIGDVEQSPEHKPLSSSQAARGLRSGPHRAALRKQAGLLSGGWMAAWDAARALAL